MSPLRSSPMYIPSITDSAHSSRMPIPQHYESDSNLSIDAPEEPKSNSSDKKYEQKSNTSTFQTSTKHKHKTKHTYLSYLSKEQILALRSAKISIKEIIDIYNEIPIQLRNRTFRSICRNCLYEISKTKSTFEEKKAMFLSLPKQLTTSIHLFKLIFEEESILLLDIMYGRTDPEQLQTGIDRLLQFFPPIYLRKQICRYLRHKPLLLSKDKNIISSCKHKLRLIATKHITSETQQKQTSPKDQYNSSYKKQKHKQELHPKAKKILNSLNNGTVDTKDIITFRKNLVLLGVRKNIIHNSFKKFRRYIQKSHREDREEVLQIINEAGKQSSKIKSSYMPTSNELQSLIDKAYTGILPLENVSRLRDLLFREYSIEKATSCFQHAKKTLIKHNKDKEQLIQKAFRKMRIKQSIKSSNHQDLQTKIKSGNLDVDTFTYMYNSLTQSDKTRSLSISCSKYIKHLSDTTPNTFEDKILLLKSLPLYLQRSTSVLKTIFPKESQLISQIKTGAASSCDIKTHFIPLLKIISPKHASRLLNCYLSKNKHCSADEKKNIDDCKIVLKQHKHTQPQPTTHKKAYHKTKKRTSSESLDSLVKEHSTSSKKNKPDMDPQAKLILESLNNCSIPAKDIVESRRQLLLLKVDKVVIRKAFHKFKKKMLRSSREDRQEIIKEIGQSGKKTRSINTQTQQSHNRLNELLQSSSDGSIPLQDIKELRQLLFSKFKKTQAYSKLYTVQTTLLKHGSESEYDIKQTFRKANPKKHSDSEIYGMQDNEASTSTYQTKKSLLTTSINQTGPSVEYEANKEKQGSFTVSSDIETIYIDPSLHYTYPWYTASPPVYSEAHVDILAKYTDTTSPQPYTSYPLEMDYKPISQFSLEQISPDDLTCILQSIVDEDENSKDQIILQQYLLQLANELQRESNTVKQTIYNHEEEQPSTSQSRTCTNIIDIQDTHTDTPMYDYEPSQVHEDFIDITELAESLNNENFNQLADTLEGEIPIQVLAPEDFFDFSIIDEK